MKIVKNDSAQHKLTVVCCLHGDEHFGSLVWDYLRKHIDDFPGLTAILVNEEALRLNKRFIDSDLNRSFPGDPKGNHEHRLAAKLLELLKNSPQVIDVHTTKCNLKMTPIIAELNRGVKTIINQTDSVEIWNMGKAPFSLIGQVPAGVSLEFGLKYSKQKQALIDIIEIIKGLLLSNSRPPLKRQIYFSSGTIDASVKLPKTSKDFKFIEGLGYPFLLHENSYKHQGFIAKRFKEVQI